MYNYDSCSCIQQCAQMFTQNMIQNDQRLPESTEWKLPHNPVHTEFSYTTKD